MPFTIAQAGLADADLISSQRRAMFVDMGYQDETALDGMGAAFTPWLVRKMAEGEYLAWVARDEQGAVAGGLGLWLMDWPPHMIGPGSPRGNILNVYTRPDYRRRGVARALMQVALEWCRVNGIKSLILHASADGRALYENLGFVPTNEMRILL